MKKFEMDFEQMWNIYALGGIQGTIESMDSTQSEYRTSFLLAYVKYEYGKEAEKELAAYINEIQVNVKPSNGMNIPQSTSLN